MTSLAPATGPSRKRLKRDTRSCLECRRRKVKCQLTSEDVSACAECIKNDVRCSIQSDDASTTRERGTHASPHVQEDRLERMEQMLRRLMELQSNPSAQQHFQFASNAFDLPLDFPLAAQGLGDSAAMDTRLGSTLVGQPATPISMFTPELGADAARQRLIGLFPTQIDVDTIADETMAWAFGLPDPPGTLLKAPTLNIAEIMTLSLASVARAILYLALYIQQLPADFDTTKLQMLHCDGLVATFSQKVASLVLSDEEIACTVEGLQCLLLLGMIHLNEGEMRKSWMSFRRAVDIAKVKGFHHSYSRAKRDLATNEAILQRHMWLSSVMGDSYTSLLLGLEAGAGRTPFGPHDGWQDLHADDVSNFERKLALASSRLGDACLQEELDVQKDLVGSVDEELDRLETSVPASWWRTPALTGERSLSSARIYNRLICHHWFLQLRMLNHLRGALLITESAGASDDRSSCLEAARITIQAYLPYRQSEIRQMHCRAMDIAVFMACVVIILGSAPASDDVRRRPNADMALVEQAISLLEGLGNKARRERICRQSAKVLKMLLAACDETLLGPGPTPSATTSLSQAGSDQEAAASQSSAVIADAGRPGSDAFESPLHEILAICFQNFLGQDHPASRLIDTAFTAARHASSRKRPLDPGINSPDTQSQSLDTFLDADIINWDF